MRLSTPVYLLSYATLAISSAIPPRDEASSSRARAEQATQKISPLSIQITSLDHTQVQAVITNNGDTSLRLLREGTILDAAPVEKLLLHGQNNARVPFSGIRKSIKYHNLPDSAFTSLAAGSNITVNVELASLHDLTSGGEFSVLSLGHIPIATGDNNDISGSVAFNSNKLAIKVDGKRAAHSFAAVVRTPASAVAQDCTGDHLKAVKAAHDSCAWLATLAAAQALSGDAKKFEEHFGTQDAAARKTVHDRYIAVATECAAATDKAKTTVHCTDPDNYCNDSTLAFTLSALDSITYCPSFFTALKPLEKACHSQDQTTTAVHEYTHADIIFKPGTQDLAYGYANDVALGSAERLLNADSYGMFVNAIWSGC
ncbi:hypothetical protein BT63DRAFT_413312 [Microthyrium microscopicum]|uniref:Neutral protease 2 n=1 Tax=Microthyrium microscopicum TaxID=703497 RepID=A0A6A6UG35_9PEZI|nr:hypothetical protein BT63DRAFT_413312 [Microthyrium microscopicum]